MNPRKMKKERRKHTTSSTRRISKENLSGDGKREGENPKSMDAPKEKEKMICCYICVKYHYANNFPL